MRKGSGWNLGDCTLDKNIAEAASQLQDFKNS